MVKKTRNMRRRKNRKQTQRGGGKFIEHLKKMFSGDPLVTHFQPPPPPPNSAAAWQEHTTEAQSINAKDLLSSLYLLSDILNRVRMTTAHDINDLNRRVATLEGLAAHHQPHATAADVPRATAPPLSIAARWH
jgi:hypothetical protein